MTDRSLKYQDLIGKKFGKLTVLSYTPGTASTREGWRILAKFLCRCDCGNEFSPVAYSVVRGSTLSCKCTGSMAMRGTKTKHEAYLAWRGMKRRCYYPGSNRYHLYGGRGIKICDRWMNFDLFVEDMGPKPSPKHSIDRINVDGDYEPLNCRWATPREQSLNQRPRGVTLYKITCAYCSKTFEAKKPTAKFCNCSCYSDAIRGVTFADKGIKSKATLYKYKCKHCEKYFEAAQKRPRIFCSKSCADDSRLKAPRFHFNCDACGKESVAPWTAAKNKRHFCNAVCKKAGVKK